MPSDIERHRKSKQHVEVTITTVTSSSQEGLDLLHRREAKKQAKKRAGTNFSACARPPKQPRIEAENDNALPVTRTEKEKGITQNTTDAVSDDNDYFHAQNEFCTGDYNELLNDESNEDNANAPSNSMTLELETGSQIKPQSKSQSVIDTFLTSQNENITRKDIQSEDGMGMVDFISAQSDNPQAPSTASLATDIAQEVVRLMEEMKLTENKEHPKQLLTNCDIANDLDEWKQIRNIIELVHKVTCFQFYYDETMQESVIRCGICFQSFLSKETRIKDLSPYQIARKASSSNDGNPVSGIWNGKEKIEQYIKGGNSAWRRLKI